jgi:hypothetical protein
VYFVWFDCACHSQRLDTIAVKILYYPRRIMMDGVVFSSFAEVNLADKLQLFLPELLCTQAVIYVQKKGFFAMKFAVIYVQCEQVACT